MPNHKKENVLPKEWTILTILLLMDGGYLLLQCAQLWVAEENQYDSVWSQIVGKDIKYFQPGFLIPVVTSNEGTHHIATNFIHLHIPLRLALISILSSQMKKTNQPKKKNSSTLFSINFIFLEEEKVKVGKGLYKGIKHTHSCIPSSMQSTLIISMKSGSV